MLKKRELMAKFLWLLLVLSLSNVVISKAMTQEEDTPLDSLSKVKSPINSSQSQSVKKDLEPVEKVKTAAESQQPQQQLEHSNDNNLNNDKNVVVISERNLGELEAEKANFNVKHENDAQPAIQNNKNISKDESKPTNQAAGQGPMEEEIPNSKHIEMDEDIEESVTTGFYLFLALSSVAILFIVTKIYRLRLSRAERKYGVQGDRTTQELTPLPISIEDGNSDEDDHTLFEINRQNIRIL